MENKLDIPTISRQTGVSIRELNRLNRDLWYHGTTIANAENISKNGVIADYNLGSELDFGPGFYLTDTYERAASYISRAPIITFDGNIQLRENWAVITFQFNPFTLLFSDYTKYKYFNFSKHNDEFAEFVFHNRMYNTYKEKPHPYDIIWGVMSDNNPFELIQKYRIGTLNYKCVIDELKKSNSMRQLFIGTQSICNMLKLQEITKEEKTWH